MDSKLSDTTRQHHINSIPFSEQLLQPGDVVGHCRVIELLAAGGMANVYKVWHEQLEVIRAIKILKPGYSDEAKGRLETEAKISANLRHPNIVEIYGMGFWNDIPYIEMEYVDGPSVKDLLEKNIRFPVTFALSVAHRVCTALQFAYNQDMTLYGKVYDRLIHRDIKPANILLTTKGIVKLADFGIARPSEVSIHTVGSKVMGTFAYLSPEQLNGEKLDQRSDVYSLGTVIYEMLTGSKTFPQKLLAELVQRKSKGQFIPVGSMGISLSRSLCSAIEKSLALDRIKRFSDASEFDIELTASLHKLTLKSPEDIVRVYLKNPYSPGIKPRGLIDTKQILQSAAILLLLFIFGVIGIYFKPVIQKKINIIKALVISNQSESSSSQQQQQAPIVLHQPPVLKDTVIQSKVRHSNDIQVPQKRITKVRRVSKDNGTLLDKALTRYSLEDYVGAISILKKIPDNTLSPKQKALRTIRLLQSYMNIGKYDEAQSIIINTPISDGLFYLLKSNVALHKDHYDAALKAAKKARTLTSNYDKNIRKKSTFQIASVLHSQYVVKPNSNNQQQALEWWNLYLSTYCSDEDRSIECHEALENISLLEQ